MRNSLKKMGRVLTPYRAGVTTDGLKHNKYRSRCFGRGACGRRAGGCDIHAAFDSPTGLIYPAMDTGNLTLRTNAIAREILVDTKTGKARGVVVHRRRERPHLRGAGRGSSSWPRRRSNRRGCCCCRSRRAHPNGIGNSSGHVGHNFCEHVMGPSVTGLVKERVGKPRTNRRRAARAGSTCRDSGTSRTSTRSSFALTASRAAPAPRCFPATRADTPGFGAAYKKTVRDQAGAFINMGGFGEVLARYENQVDLDPVRKDTWGIPVVRFNYRFGDNEKKMCEDMVETRRRRCSSRRGIRDRQRRSADPDRGLVDPRAGHGADGHRQEDLGPQPVPAVARRQQPLRRRRQQPRQRVVPEPDVDDHGARLAVVRLSRFRASEGKPVSEDLTRRDAHQARRRGHGCRVARGRRLAGAACFAGASVLHARGARRWSTS